MKKQKSYILLLFAAAAILGNYWSFFAKGKGTNPADYFDIYTTEYAQAIVDTLCHENLKGREAGTKEAAMAAAYIAGEFEKMGYRPVMQSFSDLELAQTIGEQKPGKAPYPVQQCNVLAELEGKAKRKAIVVGAHYDHLGYRDTLGIHYGADDNASGIVALLSLAKMLKATDFTPEYTILFCAWDGEEKGLLGSKYFLNNYPDSVVCYMNFDMVGRTITPESPAVTFAWNNNYPYLLDICKTAQQSIPAPFQVLLDERTGDGKGGSDYAPFSKRNIPFIAWMEDFMHEDYHKPTDTPEKLHWEKLRKTTLLAYLILFELAK